MDQFEPARRAARELHNSAVAAGASPDEPMSLVKAAVHDLDLELHWLPPGDPLLKGARALFDEQSGMICCEDSKTVGERALLAAHEVAHADIHPGSASCSTEDIDASRSMESVPVGLQRVEDYGVHERRELQADVFAREFLLPRPILRNWHLVGKMSASAIALKTQLPINVVRQQMFDSLLLPEMPLETKEVSAQPLDKDDSQERASSHRGSAFQLQAGPGTGKTRTLVKTVVSLLNGGVHPSSLLILTFSNRAAGELSERIAATLPELAGGMWIGTFHAFGLDLLRRYHDRFGLGPQIRLFDRSDAIAVLQDVLPTRPLKHYRNLWDPVMILKEMLTAISRAKDELTSPERYRELGQKMLDRASTPEEVETAEKCLEVAGVYELYEQTLRDHKSIDFGDLIKLPTELLEGDEQIRAALQLRHRHVLVDEYQDVNKASTRLLKAVAGDGKRLWVVGDSRQSIYRFRGASSDNMAAFNEYYPGATIDRLSRNYRSSKEVVDTFTAASTKMDASKGMLQLSLTSCRGETSSQPQIRKFETLEAECEGIAASVKELEASGVRLRDQAILCRTNSRLNEIACALEVRGIPVLHLGSLFEREEIRDLLSLLTLAVDPFCDGLVRVGAMARYGLSMQDIYIATRWIRESKKGALGWLAQLHKIPGMSDAGREGVARLIGDLKGLRNSSTPWEFLSTYLLDRTDLVAELSDSQSISDRMRAVAIWQFLNFAGELPVAGEGFPIQRLLNRVRDLVLLAEERDLRHVPPAALHMDAVRLLTVHGSKGLEFEAVHIPGLTTSSFPSSYRGHRCPPPIGMIDHFKEPVADELKKSHASEEQCLFFVAISRAKAHCIFYLARRTPNGSNRSESTFLSWITGKFVVEVPRPSIFPLPTDAARPAPIEVRRTVDWHLTDSQLKLYDKCPRRYFYTHVLGLGGARKTTPFSRTHDCIYQLIKWLAEVRIEAEPSLEAMEEAFEEIWNKDGPTGHASSLEYRQLASRIIKSLTTAGAGRRFQAAQPLAIDFASGKVVVEPNEMAVLANGTVILRRVQTGRKRSDEHDDLAYTLYHLAGKAKFGKQFSVEAVYLSDDNAEMVVLTEKKLNNRKEKSENMLTTLSQGWFPVETDAVTCPRCPHFFICAATPKGTLSPE